MSGASPESRKPADTPFKQQRLWAWQPILSPKWVISCFFFVAAAFIPIGALVIVASNDVKEVEVRYDNVEGIEGCTWMKESASFNCFDLCENPACMSTKECGMIGSLGGSCPRKFDKTTNYTTDMLQGLKTCDPKCEATIDVVIPETMEPPIYMYYKLTSFYQNHRRYAKSRSDAQLSGSKSSGSEVEECPPVEKPGGMGGCGADLGASCSDVSIIDCERGNSGYIASDGRCFKPGKRMRTVDDYTYSPCGLVAWSQFNDSFVFSDSSGKVVCDGANPSASECTKEGIAWDADRNEKFQTPATGVDVFTRDGLRQQMNDCISGSECKAWVEGKNLPLLPYLYNGWYLFEPYHTVPQTTDEDFMVWMRTASLPTFRKLYRKIPKERGALAAGTYKLKIDHRFDVSGFSGEKYVVFTTLTWIGGRNIFLGAVYIAIGALCVILALMFAVKHLFCRVSRQDAMQSYANMR